MILITKGDDWLIKKKLSIILNAATLALHEAGSKNIEDVLVNARSLCELLDCMKVDKGVIDDLRNGE